MVTKNKGLMTMIFSSLGIVVFAYLFQSLMGYFDDAWAIVGIEDLFMVPLILQFGPTIILITVLGGAAFGFVQGLGDVAANDANGLIRIIFGGLGLIMFLAMFSPIAEIFVVLWNLYEADPNYPLLGLTLSIFPAIILLMGIVGSIGSAVSGLRSRFKRKAAAAA